MAVYGAFISAPLGHFLIKILQKVFSGRKSLKAKILQILVSNLIVGLPFVPKAAQRSRISDMIVGLAHSEHGLPGGHGHHCRCARLPPDPCNHPGRLHACDESQLDHVSVRAGLRAEVPA